MNGIEQAGAARPPRSRLRAFAPKILLLGITLILCLAIMEGAVRIALPFFRPEAQVAHHFNPSYGIVLGSPNQTVRVATPKGDYSCLIHYNADGFRDPKNLSESKPTDWFGLGDSYTMGWGVAENERFTTLLEQEFKGKGLATRVFNVALPDNIIGYQRMLKYAEGRGASVTNLIVGVCMENDLWDYSDGKSAWDDFAAGKAPRSAK